MRIVRVTVAASALLSAHPATLWPQPASSAPVRLIVIASPATLTVGETVRVSIQLRGLQNQPARAPKDYWIYVEVRDQSQAFWMHSVPVRAGADSATVAIPIPRVGVFLIKASHPELREGAIWVNVRPKASQTSHGAARGGPYRLLAFALQSPHPSGASARVVELTIRSSDVGSKLYADGLEAAIIQAFVTAGQPRSDIKLHFLPSRGVLAPNPLVIHPSDGEAKGGLTSKERGSATLELVSIDSDDPVKIQDKKFEEPVQFLQPIRTALVSPTQPERSLIDPAEDVWVELLGPGPERRSVTPDEEVNVTLTVNPSCGDISPSSVTLTPQMPRGSVKFTPRRHGTAFIVATPFGAVPSSGVPIKVFVPWATLFAVIIGGFVGSLGAVLAMTPKGWRPTLWHGLAGIITALGFYWAIASGVLPLSPATVGNTLYAGLASILAGASGTKGIGFVWDWLGRIKMGGS
jgi:hypothetical protein